MTQSRKDSIVLEDGGQKKEVLEEARASRVASKASGLTDTHSGPGSLSFKHPSWPPALAPHNGAL